MAEKVAHDNDKAWVCPASAKSIRTVNPIRAIVDPIAKNIQTGEQRGDGKDIISLALGDPTVGGNLPPCDIAIQQIVKSVTAQPHAAGYVNACGTTEAREAIAKFHSHPEHAISPENVVVASGCSGALELALAAMLDEGTSLLVPQPGFPLYQVIAESNGANVIYYRLNPDRHWEVDFEHLEEILSKHNGSSNIRGILVNNPSNPTGAVFSKEHLTDIVNFCGRHKLPIVADEVYGDLAFGSNSFHPLEQVSAQLGRQVPVISCSGLAKQFLLPGWRVGWLAFHDNKHGSIAEVEAGAKRLAQVILGASHLAQSAIVPLLEKDNAELNAWKATLRETLGSQAEVLCGELAKCHGLEVVSPQGAMYAMVKIDTSVLDIKDDVEFSTLLLKEENVFVLPGSAFGFADVFRVVFCSPDKTLAAAAHRIAAFSERHTKK